MQSNQTGESLAERYAKAVASVESAPENAVKCLTELQHEISAKAMFSASSTESMDDISTASLPLLLLEHYLAMAYTQLPTQGIAEIAKRQSNLLMACDLWNSFLQKLESLEQLTKEELAEYRELVEILDESNSSSSNGNNKNGPSAISMPPPVNRDAKIARFRVKQQAENERQRLESLRERRGRIGIAPDEEMDGHDEEGLLRTMALAELEMSKATCLEEWSSVLRELPMIAMMVQSQEEQQGQDRYRATNTGGHETGGRSERQQQQEPRGGPLKLTHITQDSTTGQLLFRREEIRANVLRPGWNQPTMTLEELADREVAGALEREARQKDSEAFQKTQPRRYDQLRKDGLEDDADLVDASAVLDRQWDAFKDENPRGSGNKHGDVGDRNF